MNNRFYILEVTYMCLVGHCGQSATHKVGDDECGEYAMPDTMCKRHAVIAERILNRAVKDGKTVTYDERGLIQIEGGSPWMHTQP